LLSQFNLYQYNVGADGEVAVEIAAIVSSLPFGRAISMGGKGGGGSGGALQVESSLPMTHNL
jgi:hypothetical protein